MQSYLSKRKHSRQTINHNKLTTLINIDYLIINLQGTAYGEFPEDSDFKLNYYEYGTKIFNKRADLLYKSEKIGSFQHSARSVIMAQDWSQLQLENHLFYTKSKIELKNILEKFCLETNNEFKSVNRLDICLDRQDIQNTYRGLFDRIISGNVLVSGRGKHIAAYYETFRGKSVLNGFQVGKRTSEKFLRVYNKTLSLQLTEKPYINDFFQKNGLKNENVWRFEYQLNSSFFRNLLELSNKAEETAKKITWGIFDSSMLIELIERANGGFFELHENTGKSQINKENKIPIFDFEHLKTLIQIRKPIITKKLKPPISTNQIKKRLAKSLFREYYANNQDQSYVIALNMVLENINVITDKKLLEWFNSKIYFYIQEFKQKDKIERCFDSVLFREHQCLFY